ncbi:MAG: helix-turn-helix transcriptional regulator [Oscillospiraceae bacterium]|nr:helix-turn-helix transcriptional regulator [Oscillospiraceae bacterium]
MAIQTSSPARCPTDGEVERIHDETGAMTLTHYPVFPGIELIYHDVHLQQHSHTPAEGGRRYVITHCNVGRIECEWNDGFFYLEPGDISICRRDAVRTDSYYPISRYQGLTIVLREDQTPGCMSCFLADVDVYPVEVLDRLCGDADCFVMRAHPGIAHIFSELYSVPESIRTGYFKVKVLELMLFLSCETGAENQARSRTIPKSQVELGKRVCKFLSAHLSEKITIDHLARAFHVSPTQLKTSFKAVYGTSVYAYLRHLKMLAAATELRGGNATILEVAGHYGYDNASKFAKAFRDEMGMSPNEYRNQ